MTMNTNLNQTISPPSSIPITTKRTTPPTVEGDSSPTSSSSSDTEIFFDTNETNPTMAMTTDIDKKSQSPLIQSKNSSHTIVMESHNLEEGKEKEEKEEEEVEVKEEDIIIEDEDIDRPHEISTEVEGISKFKAILGILRKFIGVTDIISLRISLPASLCDPISNLEWWNYNDRPDLFIRMGDSDDPVERMLAVVKWVFSKDSKWIANKLMKPYNSILGEQFLCYWIVPTPSSNSSSESNPVMITKKSPVTGLPELCLVNSTIEGIKITCINEQISHHPPVSAFYYECKEKGIIARGIDQVCAKFTGASVKVTAGEKNKGIFVTLQGRDNEEYTITNPSGGVAGFLRGSPYVFISGESTITCLKTGLKCIIEYKDEPLLGRPKFAITGTLTSIHFPSTSPIATLSGSWRGEIHVQFSSLYTSTLSSNPSSSTTSSKPSLSSSPFSSSTTISSATTNTTTTTSPMSKTNASTTKLKKPWKGSLTNPLYTSTTTTSSSSSSASSSSSMLLIDMSQSIPFEKKVHTNIMGPMESRQVWKSVTESLLRKEYTEATKHKRFVEETQRRKLIEKEKEKEREKDNGYSMNEFKKEKKSWYESVYFDIDDDTGRPILKDINVQV